MLKFFPDNSLRLKPKTVLIKFQGFFQIVYAYRQNCNSWFHMSWSWLIGQVGGGVKL